MERLKKCARTETMGFHDLVFLPALIHTGVKRASIFPISSGSIKGVDGSTGCIRKAPGMSNEPTGESLGMGPERQGQLVLQIDILFSKWQLPWTLGASPSRGFSNRSNWYYRVRGGHQLLHRAWLNVELGCISTRLQTVGNTLGPIMM
jgi:hypothetical protein